jgi:uncharacterized protein YciI
MEQAMKTTRPRRSIQQIWQVPSGHKKCQAHEIKSFNAVQLKNLAMFILSLTYLTDTEKVDQFLAAHNDFLQKFYDNGVFICSGPKIPRDGGIILCRAKSLQEVRGLIEEDPFKTNGIAQYEITEFRVADCQPDFEVFI